MAKDRTIFLVEDNEDDVILIQRALRKGGIDAPVRVARDGDEAIDYLSGSGRYQDTVHHPMPAIILLDLKLPKKSGFEVLRWIKANKNLTSLPVVVFTTSTQEADLKQAYELGANSYLKKPYTMAETTTLLKTVSAYWLDCNERPLSLQGLP